MAEVHGVETLALTDINNTSACLNFVRLAPQHKVRPVLGVDFRRGAHQCFVALAKNNQGFEEINRFLSYLSHNKKGCPDHPPLFEHAFVIFPYTTAINMKPWALQENEYIGVSPANLNRFRFNNRFPKNKLVVLQTTTFRNKRDYNAHRLLRAIDNNTLLSKLPETEQGNIHDQFLPPKQLAEALASVPHILLNTVALLENCEIHFDFSENRKPQNQETYTGSAATDVALLRQKAAEGLAYRYGSNPSQVVLDRLEMEITTIEKMGFVSYFLLNYDIISYAQRKNYFYVGRGSGANSLVAFLLRITDVDPIDLDLYFERFINLYRVNPPDFDIDFSWQDRDDITNYIFKTFKNTALLATYSTFKHKAVVRELGKVFGLPSHEIDKLSAGKFGWSEIDHIAKLVLQFGQVIQGKPNLLSVHSSGILIVEKPLHYFTATDLPPKGYPTTQFDMLIAEDVGLYKFDILAQRGLAKIKDAVEIIKINQPDAPSFDIHNTAQFKTNAAINKSVSEAKCMGCFYVESPAMRMLLQKLEVNNYLGLVAASSIIRPGVAKSGMMREYILRHKDPERRKEAHPVLLSIMPETYGVMVYQEDVIKVAHHFAGLTLAEADVLRRGMSGKYRSRDEFTKVQEKFFDNCIERGYSEEMAKEVWRQIESFAGYAFAKGHSASYAVESYQSLFLKVHFPLEFMVAVLNNGGGFFRPEIYIHEARMQGAVVHAPCINWSEKLTTIVGKDIYLGFHYIKDLDTSTMNTLVKSRIQDGPYTDFDQFLERIPLGIEQADKLIRVGAFRMFGVNKRELLWQAHFFLNKAPNSLVQHPLFKSATKRFTLPWLPSTLEEDIFDQMEILGFPLGNPFALLQNNVSITTVAKELKGMVGKRVSILGYLVTAKNTATSRGDRMYFGTFIDLDGDFIDTVHFPPVAARYPFRGLGVYKLVGKVVDEFGFCSIEVDVMVKEAYTPDPRYAEVNSYALKAADAKAATIEDAKKVVEHSSKNTLINPVVYQNQQQQDAAILRDSGALIYSDKTPVNKEVSKD
ncbi:MAG: DNA polymerase III alpha subunit [Bacteroidia bacterium]|jgi:DNA polymerase III alpha subunit